MWKQSEEINRELALCMCAYVLKQKWTAYYVGERMQAFNAAPAAQQAMHSQN